MVKLISLVTKLYKQVQGAEPVVRDRLIAIVREARDSGVVPLGVRKGVGGNDVYLWLIFDRKHFPSNTALVMYLRERTPAGMTVDVVEI